MNETALPPALRILYLEDDANDQALAAEALKADGLVSRIVFVNDRTAFLSALDQQEFDIILSDYNVPSFFGMDALSIAREKLPNVPFIYLSGTIGEERAVESLRLGATDYVLKDRLARLAPVVRRAREEAQLRRAREEAEQAIVAERNLLRTILDNIPDAVFIINREGRFRLTNNAFVHMLGAPNQKEVAGKTAFDFLPATLAQRFRDQDLRVLHHGDPLIDHEETRRDANNRITHAMLITKVPVRDERGEITGLVGIVRDVTQRKRVEMRVAAFSMLGTKLSAARTAKEAARTIAEVARELLGWDACTCELYSAAEDKLTHVLSMDTVNGCRVELEDMRPTATPSGLARKIIDEGSKLILKEPDQMTPGAIPFGDQSRPSASILYVTIRDRATVTGVLSIHSYKLNAYTPEDLEVLQALADHCGAALERIRAQVIERQANELLKEALDVAHMGTWSWQVAPKTQLYWSQEVFRIFGVEEASFTGTMQEFFSRLHPGDLERTQEAIQAALSTDAQLDLDFRILRPDGVVRWVHAKARVVRDARQSPLRIIGVVQDITERKELEERLRHSQKMEAVGLLAGGVAHDFNNLLAVIRGNAELALMESEQLSPPIRECLAMIPAAAERAAGLTRQLLTFSRKQVMDPRPQMLSKVIADTTKMLRRIIGENIELKCVHEQAQFVVHVDTGMMEQVIVNLVLNARDAMPNGGTLTVATGAISINTEEALRNAERRNGDFVTLTVRDTGHGIAPDHLPHIFEPFFTTKQSGKGTGLGLATVYGIVQQHNGWVEVETQPGKGTAITMFLPRLAPNETVEPTVPEPPHAPGGNECILLVEDEEPVRKITRRILEGANYRVIEADSMQRALELWQHHAPEISLLLTDVVTPEPMNGKDLAQKLREQKPGLKVVFMSGYGAAIVEQHTDFFRFTRSRFIQKPYSTRTLLQILRESLDENRQTPENLCGELKA